MKLHENIKNQIKEAMRSKDVIRLDTLRGLNALFMNEMLMQKNPTGPVEYLDDDKVLALIKRSVKQRQDSIRQFEIGKRLDLAQKERAELTILESFLPQPVSNEEIVKVAKKYIDESKPLDVKSIGKITGQIMKELAGRADGNAVKAVLESLIKNN